MSYKLRVVFNQHDRMWWVVDNEGFGVKGFSKPSLARKGKLLWWMYLTTKEEYPIKYLNMLSEIN
jgi:hypothetical protein